MTFRLKPHDFPDVILLLGTDASGKDYVANALEKMIREEGGEVEKRKRFFSGPTTTEAFSTNKGLLDNLQEAFFLLIYPLMGAILPFLLNHVILWDIQKFRPPKGKKLIIVGHNGLRALAFHLGRTEKTAHDFIIPDNLRATFQKIKEKINPHVVVLDVDHKVRKERIVKRSTLGVTDRFDRYMLEDSERSERIEACLIRIAQELLDGRLMLNNDLHESEIRAHIVEGVRDGGETQII